MFKYLISIATIAFKVKTLRTIMLCLFNVMFRGRGPLKSTMDVINAAKRISEAGSQLDKLSRQIANEVCKRLFYFFFIHMLQTTMLTIG